MCAQFGPAAQLVQAVEGQQGRAADEDDDLDGVVVGDGAHAAQGGVEAGERDHSTEPIQKLLMLNAAEVEVDFRQQRREHDAARKDAHGDLRHDERDERDDGQHVARAGGEAPFEKLRHGEDQRAGVERHEHPRQHQQAPGVQLVMRHRHAVLGARAGQADDVLRADVRGEDGRADDPPAEVAAGQEVVGGGVLGPADDPPGDAEQDAEVEGNRQPVEAGQGGAGGGGIEVGFIRGLRGSRVRPRVKGAG